MKCSRDLNGVVDIPRRRLIRAIAASGAVRYGGRVALTGVATITANGIAIHPATAAAPMAIVFLTGLLGALGQLVAELLGEVLGRSVTSHDIRTHVNESPGLDSRHRAYRDPERVVRMPRSDWFSTCAADALQERADDGQLDDDRNDINRLELVALTKARRSSGALYTPTSERLGLSRETATGLLQRMVGRPWVREGDTFYAQYGRHFTGRYGSAGLFVLQKEGEARLRATMVDARTGYVLAEV